VGCLKKQVAIEVSGVEWLRKEPISIEFEMGIGLILADQEKVGGCKNNCVTALIREEGEEQWSNPN